jgi:hypothetical protein
MPDSADGSSNSEDDQLSVVLGPTEASKLGDRANSWSFRSEMRLDLSGVGFDPSARIDLAKQVVTSFLCHEHYHRNLHMVTMFLAEEILKN